MSILDSVLSLSAVPFERCNLKIAVPKFLKSSVGLQLTILLENKFFHKYFSRFFPIFKEHLFKGEVGWVFGQFPGFLA